MRKYKYLIFDADHTLLHYIKDETSAFEDLYKEIGLAYTAEIAKASRFASEDEWTKTGLYDVHDEKIQREYHNLYRTHLYGVFARIFEKFPCNADPKTTSKRFLELLAREGAMMDGAEDVVKKLSKKNGGEYDVCIATNGLMELQRARLCKLLPYTKALFVSEELGCIKPLPAFFEKMLEKLQAKKEVCLMIGDSLSSDVAGAIGVGMDSCWYNPKGLKNQTEFKPTYEIRGLSQLLEIL